MSSLLLALLAGSYLGHFNVQYSTLIVLTVAAFVALDWAERETGRQFHLVRLTLALVVIFFIVVAPTLLEIYLRHGSAAFEHIHDGALQTEEAVKFLWAGVNPYGADYTQTPMLYWLDWTQNPALHHNPYLPLTFLLVLPGQWLIGSVLGWFDVRLVYLLFLLAILFLLPYLVQVWDHKLALLIAFGLNPLFAPFFVQGRNDVLVLFFLLAMLLFLQRKRWGLAILMLGVACATKQIAWFSVPPVLVYLYYARFNQKVSALAHQTVLPLAAPFVVTAVPFLVWNPSAFVADTVVFQSAIFRVDGYGAGQLLLLLGLLKDKMAAFPFFLVEAAAAIPALVIAAICLRRRPALRVLVTAMAGLTFFVAYFNRVFYDNYIGYTIALGVIAYFLPSEEGHAQTA